MIGAEVVHRSGVAPETSVAGGCSWEAGESVGEVGRSKLAVPIAQRDSLATRRSTRATKDAVGVPGR